MGGMTTAKAVDEQKQLANKTNIELVYKIDGHTYKKDVVDDYLGYDPCIPLDIARAFKRAVATPPSPRPVYPPWEPSYLPPVVRETLDILDALLCMKHANDQALLELESMPTSQSWTDSLALGPGPQPLLLISREGRLPYMSSLSSLSPEKRKKLLRRMYHQRNRDTSPPSLPPNSAQRPLPILPSPPSTNPSDPPSSTPSPTRSASTPTNRERPTQARATPARATAAGATPLTRQRERAEYKYAELVCAAIISSENQRMPLSSIYNWLSSHFITYPTMAEDAVDYKRWTGNTRHNLTTHEEFVQVNRESKASRVDDADNGKGELWVMAHSQKARALVVKMRAATLPDVRGGYVS